MRSRTTCSIVPATRGDCTPPSTSGENTLDEVVDSYIRDYRKSADLELRFFRDFKSLIDAIEHAAHCRQPNGKRNRHQNRLPREVLAEAARNLLACSVELNAAADFDELHRIVEREIHALHGIGVLTVYDVATRIGARLGKSPNRVYLHAGSAAGAKALGIPARRQHVAVAELPRAFHRLKPYEIENCLCIFKRAIARICALSDSNRKRPAGT